MDYDLLVKLGWTALISWNLRETIAMGKQIARIETRLENGLSSDIREIKEEMRGHIDGEEQRIIGAIIQNPGLRPRHTD